MTWICEYANMQFVIIFALVPARISNACMYRWKACFWHWIVDYTISANIQQLWCSRRFSDVHLIDLTAGSDGCSYFGIIFALVPARISSAYIHRWKACFWHWIVDYIIPANIQHLWYSRRFSDVHWIDLTGGSDGCSYIGLIFALVPANILSAYI